MLPRSFWRRLFLVVAMAMGSSAWAGADLQAVKSRGFLRCGVSDDIPGFSVRDASGHWQGMNVDFCRAVAAAVFGNPEQVEFIPLKASKRFPALQSKRIDLLVRNTTWTFSRETLLKVQFPAVLFYDGQGFMVPKSSRIKSVAQLKGKTVCVENATTHEKRLMEYFQRRSQSVTPLVIDSASGAAEALFAGRCDAYTSDASQLAALRTRAPDGGKGYEILPERISKEPMGPVIRSGDVEWATLVGWVRHILFVGEEFEITQANVEIQSSALKKTSRSWRMVSGDDDLVTRTLGVRADWAVQVLKAVGNYQEIFDRHLGKNTPLNIDRGYNRLWTEGGMMFAPPID